MKKLLMLVPALFLLSFTSPPETVLSKAEKDKAIMHLKDTKAKLLSAVKGLSDAQLNWKPDGDTWSVAECVEHLAISEGAIFGIVQGTLKDSPDPAKRSEVKFSDDQVIGLIEDRSTKVKTRPNLEPTQSLGDFKATLKAFKTGRKKSIKYVKKTEDDLRNRYFTFPFGTVDSYQVVLFLSGHTGRHIAQIEEVMANPAFPK